MEQFRETPKDSGIFPMEDLSMYEIPGQDPITEHSFNRYLKDRESEKNIRELIESPAYQEKKKLEDIDRDERWFAALVDEGLGTDNAETQIACAQAIWNVPGSFTHPLEEKIYLLIEKGLDDGNYDVQAEYAKVFNKVFYRRKESNIPEITALENKVYSIIEAGFGRGDLEADKKYAEMISSAPVAHVESLVEKALAMDNVDVTVACAQAIYRIPSFDRQGFFTEKIYALAEKSFINGDAAEKGKYAKIVHCLPYEKQAPFVEKGMAEENVEVRKIYARAIRQAPPEKRKELFEKAKASLGNSLVEPLLYKDKNISADTFSRDQFEKTGSATTLIGGSLKGKTILRHIDAEAFLAWQKMYEDHALWKNAGFDYVPVEPIQSFKLNKDGLIDVYSGVLDISLHDWNEMWGNNATELEDEAESISEVLNSVEVIHGHPHSGNFCLRFFRDNEGNVDFTKKPRIYIIDFDRAVSPAPEKPV